MDLSHWDLLKTFSIPQIACLAVGIDPNVDASLHDPALTSKARVFALALDEASREAWAKGDKYTADINEPEDTPWFYGEELWDRQNQREQLPSTALLLAVTRRFQVIDKTPLFHVRQRVGTEQYQRKYIRNWFEQKNITTIYKFDNHYSDSKIDAPLDLSYVLPNNGGENGAISNLQHQLSPQDGNSSVAVEKPLLSKKKNNYLRVIMALAMTYIPDFDPHSHYTCAKKIKELTGLRIDEKTMALMIDEGYKVWQRDKDSQEMIE